MGLDAFTYMYAMRMWTYWLVINYKTFSMYAQYSLFTFRIYKQNYTHAKNTQGLAYIII